MAMQFAINKEYANRYNEFRRKEELQKLRERYGDIKMNTNSASTKGDDLSVNSVQNEESSDSSSSDSTSSEYSGSSDDDHEDFLVLYDALCRNDVSLSDPNKHWFRVDTRLSTPHDQDPAESEPGPAGDSDSHIVENKSKRGKTSLNLRDYQRKFLLEDGGLEDETAADDAALICRMESDQILDNLTKPASEAAKQMFLSESTNALEQAGFTSDSISKESNGLDFLQRRTYDSNTECRTKVAIDFEALRFTDTSNTEAEEFLRDYIVNQRWKRPKAALPCYEEVLHQSNINVDADSCSTLFDGNISEDDGFLLKAREFDRANQAGNSVFACDLNEPTFPKYRFQEEDKEFVKSYPRNIESSLQHPTAHGKSLRSLKREARKARKLKVKQTRMHELRRLRHMKLAIFADKISRIRRSCGAGCSIPELTPCGQSAAIKNASNRHAVELAMYLDEDWDPDKHSKLLENMFGESYYSNVENEHKIPRFSDMSDIESDESSKTESKRSSFQQKTSSTVSSGTTRSSLDGHGLSNSPSVHHLRQSNALSKSLSDSALDSDCEAYFGEHIKLTCDDIITGPTPDDDIYCRFPYRQVSANDFGLSTEEVLTASTRELNSWVSIRRVAGYLTEQEEERNRRLYHSGKKLRKKSKVITSLNDPNAHWWPDTDKDPSVSTTSGEKKRRSRKKRKRKGMSVEALINDLSATNRRNQMRNEALASSSKCVHARTKKIKGINVSFARLAASGLTLKDVYRVQNTSRQNESPSTVP